MHSEKNLLGVFLKDRRCKIASRFLYGRVLDVGCNAGELRAFLSPEQ